MFNIKKLKISRNNKSRVLIEDFSFTFKDSDKVALVGEEGTGKSSLIKAMVMGDSLDYASVEYEELSKNRVVAYVPQQIFLKEVSKKWFITI